MTSFVYFPSFLEKKLAIEEIAADSRLLSLRWNLKKKHYEIYSFADSHLIQGIFSPNRDFLSLFQEKKGFLYQCCKVTILPSFSQTAWRFPPGSHDLYFRVLTLANDLFIYIQEAHYSKRFSTYEKALQEATDIAKRERIPLVPYFFLPKPTVKVALVPFPMENQKPAREEVKKQL